MLRRRSLVVVAGVVLLLGVAGVAVAWYVLREERRLAVVVSRVLQSRTGLPIAVDRAATDGSRLTLRGVRIPSGPGFPLEVRMRELEISGGVMPLVAPAGRSVSIVAVATSVKTPGGAAGAPDAGTIETVRSTLLSLLGWPGTATLSMAGGGLEGAGGTYHFDLTGEKSATGVLTLAFGLRSRGQAPAVQLDARAWRSSDQALEVHLELGGSPREIESLWPNSLPVPERVAIQSDLKILTGSSVVAVGRATFRAATSAPVIDFASRYDAKAGQLNVSRYAVDWPPDVRLEGTGIAELGLPAARVRGTASGTIERSRINARAAYDMDPGTFEGELTASPVDQSIARRFGVALPSVEVTSREVHARFSGSLGAGETVVSADMTAIGLKLAALQAPIDAVLTATIHGTRQGGSVQVTKLDHANMTLSREGVRMGQARIASGAGRPWPLRVDARVDDLTRLGPVLPQASALAGSARVVGDWVQASPLRFSGSLDATLDRAQVTMTSPVTLSGLKAHVPLAWGASDEATETGSLFIERISGYGVGVTNLTSGALATNGRLLLSDMRYTHYAGRGGGWLEVVADGSSVLVRSRLEGEHVDLAVLIRELGWNIGQITGRVRYLLTAQYSREHRLLAAGHLDSEDDGGEVGIDAIQRLLDSAIVEAESTGLLRRTLENLRVFKYQSLDGDLRVSGGASHLDLSLHGKKRFAIFPGPVKEINFRNVPLDVLTRTFTGNAR